MIIFMKFGLDILKVILKTLILNSISEIKLENGGEYSPKLHLNILSQDSTMMIIIIGN